MAKGRKRLIAGWGLLAFAGVMTAGIIASRWWAIEGQIVGVDLELVAGRLIVRSPGVNPAGVRINARAAPMLAWSLENRSSNLLWVRPTDETSWGGVWRFRALSNGRRRLEAMVWPAAVATVIVGLSASRWGRRAREALLPAHCPTCGYDLSATPTPTFPTCPECGTAR